MWGKSRRNSFNTEVIVDFSASRAWTPHAIFLSDRNGPLWECWYNLSNLTNQRVYQERVVYRNDYRLRRPCSPQYLPFYFRLRAFSIQRARLSRSLEQVKHTLTLKMTTTLVVERSVTVNNNRPIQDYVHPDDQTQPTFEMTPGFKPFTQKSLITRKKESSLQYSQAADREIDIQLIIVRQNNNN